MTRDAEHTPSPQSVVPVGPKRVLVLKSAVERLILAADMYGVAHLDSDDMDDDAVELQDATEGMKDALAAAPAPSSLAGGEVQWGWRVRSKPGKFSGDRPWHWQIDEPTGITAENCEYGPVYTSILAALSPEAPALEASEWFGVTGASDETEALAVALFDARCPGIRMTDEDLHYYRAAAQRAMQAVADELDTPALTPRHEAPASEDESRRKLIQCIEQWDGETEYDADDLASLADSILHAFNGPPVVSPAAPVQLSSNPCQLEAPAEGAGELLPCPFCGSSPRYDIGKVEFIDAEVCCENCGAVGPNFNDAERAEDNLSSAISAWNLRARSSAPEAREREAVAENLRLKAALGAAIKADNALSRAVWAEGELDKIAAWLWEQGHQLGREAVADTAIVNLARLRDLSATPSADKLREVVEGFVSDLTGLLKNRSTMLTINHNALTARIDQALAALKGEG